MYIIDGYNLLHAIPRVDENAGLMNDIQLCRILSSFMKVTAQIGEIIFDGTGPRDTSIYDNINHLQVSFAGIGTDTDTVIEDKIKANTAPKRLIIVSSDRRLRKAARARKATSLKSEEFWIQINKQLSKKRPKPEPGAKRHGLSESETKQWLDFFDLE
jgi:predicted RNA-binding protein with PIN domain